MPPPWTRPCLQFRKHERPGCERHLESSLRSEGQCGRRRRSQQTSLRLCTSVVLVTPVPLANSRLRRCFVFLADECLACEETTPGCGPNSKQEHPSGRLH